MATQTQTPHVNIAGDFSSKGIDVAPGDIAMNDFEDEADELGEMRDIAPRAPKLVNPSSKTNVNTDWPVDE